MIAPYFKTNYVIASKFEIIKAKIFGSKISDIKSHGITIYKYKGVWYVTEFEGRK